MQKKDLKIFLFGFGVLLASIALSFPDFLKTVTKTFDLDTSQLQTTVANTNLYYFRNLELGLWRLVKGTEEEFIKYAQLPHYEDLLKVKLEGKGLAIDEDGEVVPKDQLGKLKPPFKFLLIGSSSMLEGVGPTIERDLYTIPQMTVVREGKYSTGLNRKDYFNWYPHAKRLIQTHKPDAIVVEFGGNDGQAIVDKNGVKIYLSDSRWDQVYEERVREFMRILTEDGQKVYWLELPIPRTTEFQVKYKRINGIFEKVAPEFKDVIYVKTWDRFAINGAYSASVKDDYGKAGLVKYADGIHLTPHGSKIMSKLLLDKVKEDLVLE